MDLTGKSIIDFNKNTLRKIIKQKSKALSDEYRSRASREIAERVIALEEFQNAKTVFIYVSMKEEPDTRLILEAAWKAGKTVTVPRCMTAHEMDAVIIHSFDELQPRTLGILEPAPDLPVLDASDIEFGVIPCVSLAKDGRRMGHGAGYYDYFLNTQGMVKACICFEKLMDERIPVGEHDIPMDIVVSEHDTIHIH